MSKEEEYGDVDFDLEDNRPRIARVKPEMEGNVGFIVFILSDDRQIIMPVDWYMKLKLAGPHDIVVYEIVQDGQAVAWPTLNCLVHMRVLQEGKSAISKL